MEGALRWGLWGDRGVFWGSHGAGSQLGWGRAASSGKELLGQLGLHCPLSMHWKLEAWSPRELIAEAPRLMPEQDQWT